MFIIIATYENFSCHEPRYINGRILFFFFFFFALVTQLLLSKTGITSAYENKNMDFYWPVWYFDS